MISSVVSTAKKRSTMYEPKPSFARGSVLIRVGQNDYTADVVVGTRENGSMVLYDILNLRQTTFTKNETNAAKSTNPSPGAARNTALISANSIRQNEAKSQQEKSVAEKYALKLPGYEKNNKQKMSADDTQDDKYRIKLPGGKENGGKETSKQGRDGENVENGKRVHERRWAKGYDRIGDSRSRGPLADMEAAKWETLLIE